MARWITNLLLFVVTVLVLTKGSDVLKRAFFGGGAGERTLYMKLPLDLPRFHWQFTSEADVLAGRLEVEIARHDGPDTVLTVFRDGWMEEGWKAIESDRGTGELYFGFTFGGRVPTHPRDSVIVRFDVPRDLHGEGRWYTATLPAGTYEAVASYSVATGHPTLAAIVPGSRTDEDATAYIGCWRERWRLDIGERRGWAGTPEDREDGARGVLSFVARLAPDDTGTDGGPCIEGGDTGR